jgi:hypothetical protein
MKPCGVLNTFKLTRDQLNKWKSSGIHSLFVASMILDFVVYLTLGIMADLEGQTYGLGLIEQWQIKHGGILSLMLRCTT